MHTNRTILAIFKDMEDEASWSSLLKGVNDVIRVVAGPSLSITLENLEMTGIEPILTILSARLYPVERPDLISCVRRRFPATNFLLVSSSEDPAPPLQPLINDMVRHLAITPALPGGGTEEEFQLLPAVKNLVEGRPWEISDYLKPSTVVHEFTLFSSREKEELIRLLEGLIKGDSPEYEMLRHKGALLADEMLENAMYGAPRDEVGERIFQKGEMRAILPGEEILFRFAFDGEILAMEVSDSWGSLSPNLVMDHLAGTREDGKSEENGGRGLFIIWRFLDHFHVSINPGKFTVVGGRVRLSSPADPFGPRGFHITTCQR